MSTCPWCGYDELRIDGVGTCPECGELVTEADITTWGVEDMREMEEPEDE